MEQHEWPLFVDVSKMDDRNLFYVSVITPNGKLTAEAGEVIRSSKNEQSALLIKFLSQIRVVKASGEQ